MLDFLTLTQTSNLFRQSWRDANLLQKEKLMQLDPQTKMELVRQHQLHINTDTLPSNISGIISPVIEKWQYRRVAIRHGLSLSHAKLICSLSGLGDAVND